MRTFMVEYDGYYIRKEIMKIKEVIVVEGKHDADTIKKYVDCDTIETQGTHLGKRTLKLIEKVNEERGIIIFTDPDAPGERIRMTINQAVAGCKNAFIDKKLARTSKKVGVEHAQKEDILNALAHLMSYDDLPAITITQREFLELGLNGAKDSQKRREILGNALFIGKANAKTLWKRLNMLGLHKQDIEEILKEQ